MELVSSRRGQDTLHLKTAKQGIIGVTRACRSSSQLAPRKCTNEGISYGPTSSIYFLFFPIFVVQIYPRISHSSLKLCVALAMRKKVVGWQFICEQKEDFNRLLWGCISSVLPLSSAWFLAVKKNLNQTEGTLKTDSIQILELELNPFIHNTYNRQTSIFHCSFKMCCSAYESGGRILDSTELPV